MVTRKFKAAFTFSMNLQFCLMGQSLIWWYASALDEIVFGQTVLCTGMLSSRNPKVYNRAN